MKSGWHAFVGRVKPVVGLELTATRTGPHEGSVGRAADAPGGNGGRRARARRKHAKICSLCVSTTHATRQITKSPTGQESVRMFPAVSTAHATRQVAKSPTGQESVRRSRRSRRGQRPRDPAPARAAPHERARDTVRHT